MAERIPPREIMKKPIILSSDYKDACSFYRGLGPLGRLRQKGLIDLIVTPQMDWTVVSRVDLVFMLRPESAWQRQLAQLCYKLNTPLWVDFDDDLFHVPGDNPNYRHYASEETQGSMKECLGFARLVTVSTPALARSLSQYSENVHVVPNALDPRVISPNQRRPKNKIILWRGSPTHDRDLEEYSDAIVSAAEDNPGWTWFFQGCNPWRLIDRLQDHGAAAWGASLALEDYMLFLSGLGAPIMIVPLSDSGFNRCKSNIAWIEATYAGAETLAPNWEEWQRLGVTTYDNPNDFATKLSAMMSTQWMGDTHANTMSSDYIHTYLGLDEVNKKRLDLIIGATKKELECI